jgi:hypothetical protein
MCEGSVTKLRCPHVLAHFAVRCGKKRKCKLPQGPRFYLDDCCAKCHPSHQERVINIKYELLLDELNAQLRAAKAENLFEEVADIERRIREVHFLRTEEVTAANKVRSALDVLWPGKREDW